MEAWTIEIVPEAEDFILHKVKKFYQPTIRKRIEEELAYAPFIETKHKKVLDPVPEEHRHLGVPIWQLTVYPFRAQYGLDVTGHLKVLVVEIFKKTKEKKTR